MGHCLVPKYQTVYNLNVYISINILFIKQIKYFLIFFYKYSIDISITKTYGETYCVAIDSSNYGLFAFANIIPALQQAGFNVCSVRLINHLFDVSS